MTGVQTCALPIYQIARAGHGAADALPDALSHRHAARIRGTVVGTALAPLGLAGLGPRQSAGVRAAAGTDDDDLLAVARAAGPPAPAPGDKNPGRHHRGSGMSGKPEILSPKSESDDYCENSPALFQKGHSDIGLRISDFGLNPAFPKGQLSISAKIA